MPVAPPSIQPPVVTTACTYGMWYNYSKMQFTANDTVIDSLTYKIVREETDLNFNTCDFGYVREDTTARKVWFRDNAGNPEFVLYDFSLIPGDTFSVNFNVSGGLYASGNYTLDSIVAFQIQNRSTRLFCLRDHSTNFSPTLYWAEGVGCLMNAFYTHSMNAPVGMPIFWQCNYYPQNSYEFMTCFDHDTKVYYDSCKYASALSDQCFMVTDSCNYHNICGNISENTLAINLTLFPAPATDFLDLNITSAENQILHIEIADIYGHQVKTALTLRTTSNVPAQTTIDISGLGAGTYLLTLKSESKAYTETFIKQ
jgi:hypothetical protein